MSETVNPTPGPWRFEAHQGYPGIDPDGQKWPFGYITGRQPIFELNVFLEYPADELRAAANAMAAAPDTMAALRELLDLYVGLVNCGDCGFWDPEKEAEVIAARAAIAKAEGRS